MRRLAAVFAHKRSDRSDAASSSAQSATTKHTQATTKHSKRFFRSISRNSKSVDPIVNHLNSTDIHPPSSSSSSSGAPTTPDDDRRSLPESKAWLSLPHSESPLGSFHHLDPPPHHRPYPLPSNSALDTEDESSEESSVAPDLPHLSERSTPLAAPAYLLALTSSNLRPPYAPPPLLHISDGPSFPRSCNPTRTLPHADSLQATMHRTRLQRHLQHGHLSPSASRAISSFSGRRTAIKERPSLHLDDTVVREEHVRFRSAGLKKWAHRPCFEDRVLVLLAENVPASPSTEPRWTRIQPATAFGVAALDYSVTLELLAGFYEDVLPREQNRHEPVPDASALGYLRSDTQLDLGPSLTNTPSAPIPASSLSSPSPSVMLSASTTPTSSKPPPATVIVPSQLRGPIYKASPSPLRMEAASASPSTARAADVPPVSLAATAVASSDSPPPTVASPPVSSAPPPLKSALKQGVRFAEEEKEDRVPLGYVMRIKQERTAKAHFLKAEDDRRRHDEERRIHDEEKRRWEEERAQWEREKRAMSEERKRRLLSEEVVAARTRRESQRYGSLGAMTGDGLATGQWDRGERSRPERQSIGVYSRAAYDPASSHSPIRQGSDSSLALQPPRRGSTSGSGSGSPEDSRPNSVYGTGSVNGSRPSSVYSGALAASSSQQDVRNRERRTSGAGSHRGSIISESGGSWRQSNVPPLPVWNGLNLQAWNGLNAVAPMPMAMPMYMGGIAMGGMGGRMYDGMALDTVLLPPSPPFMQQSSRRFSGGHNSQPSSPQRSHSSSPTLGRQQPEATDSSERVDRMSQVRSSSASSRAPPVPRSESVPNRPRHQRTSSGDTPLRPSAVNRSRTEERQASITPHRPGPTHSSSMYSHPPPAFPQARSSWALPPTGFENLSRRNSGRRQTLIS